MIIISFLAKDEEVLMKLIKHLRELLGPTDPSCCIEGHLRKEFGENITQNAFHCSDSIKSAIRESGLIIPFQIKENIIYA